MESHCPTATQCGFISGNFLVPDAAIYGNLSSFPGDIETILQQPRALKTQLQDDTWSVGTPL